jgi:hypothetical protein
MHSSIGEIMFRTIVLAIGIFFSAIVSASAVDLKDCSTGATEKRLVCMQENIVLLNSSYQTVAAELRSAVKDLKGGISGLGERMSKLETRVSTLEVKVSELKKQVDGIKVPDTSAFVRRDTPVKLGTDNAHCIAFASGISGDIAGTNPPVKAQLLMLAQDCPGAPPLNFK